MMTADEFQRLYARNKGKGRTNPTANQTTEAIIRFLNSSGYIAWRNNTTGIFDPQKTVANLLKFINSLNGRKATAKGIAACMVFRKHHGIKGVPDIIGLEKGTGRFIAVEVKAGKDKLSPEQDFFIKQANRNNGMAYVARSFDDFLEQLKQHKDAHSND